MSMSKLSVYGATGFIGGTFCDLYPDEVIKIPREEREPQSKDIIYFISTTTNSHVFKDLHKDVDTNLTVLMDVLEHCKDEDLTFKFVSSAFVYGTDVIAGEKKESYDPARGKKVIAHVKNFLDEIVPIDQGSWKNVSELKIEIVVDKKI